MSVTPFYLSGTAGRIHATHFPAVAPASESIAVLVLPPFAEEMNKSRPMLATAARRLSTLGIATLIVDPLGTGDSAGDFADATWDQWVADFRIAWDWLNTQGYKQIHLLALRSGALLIADVIEGRNTTSSKLGLWQPTIKGADFWRQFLRLRVAADAMREQVNRVSPQDQLRQEGRIEIAGYTVTSGLAASLASAELRPTTIAGFRSALWAEIALAEPAVLSMGTQRTLGQWQLATDRLQTTAIKGEHFWATPEIALAPALIDITCAFLAGETP